jgi:hypothetical protein
MIWLILGAIACVGIIIRICCDSCNDWVEKVLFSIFTVVISPVVILLALSISSAIISCDADMNYNMVSDTKIIALKDNQNVSGSFYIMGGYVDEDLYYYYATETEFGYKTEKVKANNAYIKYTDGETHIERYVGEFANEKNNLWGFPICDDRYIIYCLDGTVTNEFIVDLE